MRNIALSFLLTTASPALAQTEATPTLASIEECTTGVQDANCIGDLRKKIRFSDGLTLIDERTSPPVPLRLGGMDCQHGPEDSDGKVTYEEWLTPATARMGIFFVSEGQAVVCMQTLLDKGIVTQEQFDTWSDPALREESPRFGYSMLPALTETIYRTMKPDFDLYDINGDGSWSVDDDFDGNNMVTKEDKELFVAQKKP